MRHWVANLCTRQCEQGCEQEGFSWYVPRSQGSSLEGHIAPRRTVNAHLVATASLVWVECVKLHEGVAREEMIDGWWGNRELLAREFGWNARALKHLHQHLQNFVILINSY